MGGAEVIEIVCAPSSGEKVGGMRVGLFNARAKKRSKDFFIGTARQGNHGLLILIGSYAPRTGGLQKVGRRCKKGKGYLQGTSFSE